MRTNNWGMAAVLSAMMVLLLATAQRYGSDDVRARLDEATRHVRLMLHKLARHVKKPFDRFAKRKPVYGAPFTAVRWRDSVPEVQVKDTWYELLALNDVTVEEIVRYCKETYGRIWRKRFEEDLTIALDGMGKLEHFDSETGTGSLTVRRLDTGDMLVLTDVPWTWDNRMAILCKALERWKANGREDPRDDPRNP